jgi:hypothetical protein
MPGRPFEGPARQSPDDQAEGLTRWRKSELAALVVDGGAEDGGESLVPGSGDHVPHLPEGCVEAGVIRLPLPYLVEIIKGAHVGEAELMRRCGRFHHTPDSVWHALRTATSAQLIKARRSSLTRWDSLFFSTSSMELPTLSSEPIELTPLGNTWVDSDRALRRRAARGALLTWLGEQGATKQNPIDVTDFPAVKRAVGRAFLSQADLTDASDFLVSEGLIERVADPPDGVPEKAWPTSKGVHCGAAWGVCGAGAGDCGE